MRSLFTEIINKKDQTQKSLFEYINGVAPELFELLLEPWQKIAKNVMVYIAYAYSYDSDYIIKGTSWQDNKKALASLAGIAEYNVEAISNLKSEPTKKVILAYLEWQGNREFRHLQTNKDMYDFLTTEIIKDMTKETPDFAEMDKKRKWRDELLDDINKLEEKLNQKYKPIIVLQAEIKNKETSDMDLANSQYIN